MSKVYTVDSTDDLYDTADTLPEVAKRGTILAVDDDLEDGVPLTYRTPLISENGSVVGDVSKKHYHEIQFSNIMEAVAHAADQYSDTLDLSGNIIISDDDRKLNSYLEFDGVTAEPIAGDRLDLGVKTRAQHTGMHGVRYDIGAQRLICSNGMTAFDSAKEFYQDHNQPLDYGLAKQAVDSIVSSVDDVEHRIQQAADREFHSRQEALITLRHLGIGDEFDDPVAVLEDALQAEVDDDQTPPTLWDAYNAATRAYTHESDLAVDQRDHGLAQAACLIDDYGDVPDAAQLGESAVMRRSEALVEPETEEYWTGEEDVVSELLQQYGESA